MIRYQYFQTRLKGLIESVRIKHLGEEEQTSYELTIETKDAQTSTFHLTLFMEHTYKQKYTALPSPFWLYVGYHIKKMTAEDTSETKKGHIQKTSQLEFPLETIEDNKTTQTELFNFVSISIAVIISKIVALLFLINFMGEFA